MYRILLIVMLCLVAVSVRADEDANAKLFEVHSRLAAMGSAEAQFKLGEMCEEGRGTPRDLVKAREWYEKAAKQGHAEARRRLETLGKRKISDDADKMAQEVELIKKRTEEERQATLQKREEEDRRVAEERKREDERMRQLQAQKRMEDEQKTKLAAQQRKQEEEKAKVVSAPQPAIPTAPSRPEPMKVSPPATKSTAAVTDNKDESFESDPCKSAAARFMSTCH